VLPDGFDYVLPACRIGCVDMAVCGFYAASARFNLRIGKNFPTRVREVVTHLLMQYFGVSRVYDEMGILVEVR
jgi:hypothetical protein